MLLKNYAEQNLLTNLSVNGETSEAGVFAYRGDMVLEEGEIADDQGRRLPPIAVIKQATVLIKDDKISMISGIIADLKKLPLFIEMYRHDLAPDIQVLFYIENLTRPTIVDLDGVNMILIPHEEGAAWQTLMDDIRLEKSDFKGQSAEDKVITMAAGLAEFKPNYDSMGFEEATAFISTVVREHRGPV